MADSFRTLSRQLDALGGLDVLWCVAGGWAIDLWIGEVTRSHHDVDIMVARSDQSVLFEHLEHRDPIKVIPHPEGLIGQGSLESWDGEWLGLPIHQVFADGADGERIEILFGEVANGRWAYRRNAAATMPMTDLVITGPTGIPAMAPEAVLLFKAKLGRPWDEADFSSVVGDLPEHRLTWLVEALELSHPDHPWIERLR